MPYIHVGLPRAGKSRQGAMANTREDLRGKGFESVARWLIEQCLEGLIGTFEGKLLTFLQY